MSLPRFAITCATARPSWKQLASHASASASTRVPGSARRRARHSSSCAISTSSRAWDTRSCAPCRARASLGGRTTSTSPSHATRRRRPRRSWRLSSARPWSACTTLPRLRRRSRTCARSWWWRSVATSRSSPTTGKSARARSPSSTMPSASCAPFPIRKSSTSRASTRANPLITRTRTSS